MRDEYTLYGVEGYYTRFGAHYRNPQEAAITEALKQLNPKPCRVLDLACGSGEATLALRNLGFTNIIGIDPYTGEAYRQRTGQTALSITFEGIAAGLLAARYDMVVCSFALHLVEESRLPLLLWRLTQLAPRLVVISPIKRPPIEQFWRLKREFVVERVHLRDFESQTLNRSFGILIS